MIISLRDPLKSAIFSLPMVQLHASLTLGRGKPFQAPPIPRAAKRGTRGGCCDGLVAGRIKSRFVAGKSNSSRSRLRGDGGGQARFAAATMPPHRHGAGIEGEVLVALADPYDATVLHCAP